MIKYILFDLDGTLLPMDQNAFVKEYFSGLAKKLLPYGYEPNQVVSAVQQGVVAMAKNNGPDTNEIVFWEKFSEILGEEILNLKHVFEDYYKNEFQKIKDICGFEPKANEAVNLAKNKGFKVVLATSPMFPNIATESRLRWAGFEPEDFELVSTYEDYHSTKPNIAYYNEVLENLGASPNECVMVGNDALEDMIAKSLGMNVFLLTDCLINRKEQDLSEFEKGNFDDLKEFINNL